MVVVFFFLHYPLDTFLLTIGTASAIVDSVFLVLFVQRRRQLAQSAGVNRAIPNPQAALGLP